MIEDFFKKLKESMEEHSKELKRGDAFLPAFLKGRKLTKDIFPAVAKSLAGKLDLQLQEEVHNPMPEEYECGNRQRVDYVFRNQNNEKDLFYLELESLDRSQLYVFWEKWDGKLKYYDGTIGNFFTHRKAIPKYFVWFLTLPDREVSNYQIWDTSGDRLLHPDLKKIIYHNPYRFYDHLIKTCARFFLNKTKEFKDPQTNKWTDKTLMEFQNDSELVFITCTIKELILSRGKDGFDPKKEIRVKLNW